ncbi:MAG: ATP-dependent RNA helicase HrpA [Kiritimatiellae bacterium]|nr:ATP-dependent RNA helicase HrpA [Kiritimatiellia bacterium]
MDPAARRPEPDLPVLARRDEIAAAVRDNQVVVVRGETGSGKTTQIPRILLEAGRGARGRRLAVTQPRRLAAVAVAERVAQELGADRNLVGWQHRFAKKLSRDNRIKFMTDGILLAELRTDPLLRAYDTVMVDEAHERTLNVDFVLGCLKRILPRRPDLRVVVSSATLDTTAFSEFFGGAPVISVPGRTFPVEVRWRPPPGEDPDLPAAVADAVEECLAGPCEGDVLVFLPGERDIRAAAEVLEGRRLPHVVVLPLLASLPPAEQRRAFRTIPGETRVVLATNVAETSVTIPGVRYVVDSGLARVARYNPRARVKRLHVEPVSQASAEQRKGRCGRIGPGVCIRLYDEADFARRPAQTDPEIRRASLAGTILSMLDWELGDVADFPFLQPPAAAAVSEGKKQLLLLGAAGTRDSATAGGARVAGSLRITPLGRKLAKLPVDPALGRMLHEAAAAGALRDALVVVSALACEDPLLRPADRREAAETAHAAFRGKDSDFAGILLLWRRYHDPHHPLSRSAARRDCQKNFVSWRRLCEWEDVHAQLSRLLAADGLDVASASGGSDALHRAILSGVLPNVGVWDGESKDYRGAGGVRFRLWPGSCLAKAKTPPPWIAAAELVDTSRLWARRAAAIDPAWIEPLARGACRYHYTGESWDPRTGTARATRTAVLWGLVVQDGVRVDIAPANPGLSRAIFIREGLVLGAFPKPVPPFVRRNLETIEAATETARKERTMSYEREIDAWCERYDAILPRECVNVPALRDWLAARPPAAADRLLFPRPREAARSDPGAFPDHIEVTPPGGVRGGARPLARPSRVPLSYEHSPGSDADGLTCTLRPEQTALVPLLGGDRLVPGLLRGKALYLLRTLPHSSLSLLAAATAELTGASVRAPDTDAMADAILPLLPPEGPLGEALVRLLAARFGVRLPLGFWREADLPAAMRMRWRVADRRGRELFATRDEAEIAEFRAEHERLAPGALPSAAELLFGAAPPPPFLQPLEIARVGSRPVVAWAALGADGRPRLFPAAAAALAAHRAGVAAACRRAQNLETPPGASPLAAQCLARAALETFGADPLPRTPAELAARGREAAPRVRELARDLRALADAVEALGRDCLDALEDAAPRLRPESARDLAEQLGWLLPPDFAAATPVARLAEFPRYLEAVQRRLDKARFDPAGDARRMAPVRQAWERYVSLVRNRAESPPFDEAAAERYRWLVEEFRVATFAQALGTPEPASRPRLDRLWAETLRA